MEQERLTSKFVGKFVLLGFRNLGGHACQQTGTILEVEHDKIVFNINKTGQKLTIFIDRIESVTEL